MFINKRSHIDIHTHLFETHPNAQVPLRSPIGMKRRLEGGLIQNDTRNQLQVAGLFPQSFIMLKSKISSKTIQWRSAPKFSQKKKNRQNPRNQRGGPRCFIVTSQPPSLLISQPLRRHWEGSQTDAMPTDTESKGSLLPVPDRSQGKNGFSAGRLRLCGCWRMYH